MRILYIGDQLEAHSGVTHKMMAQATEWTAAGHSVWLATPANPVPRPLEAVREALQQPAPNIAPGSAPGLPGRAVRRLGAQLTRYGRLLWEAERLGIDLVYTRELAARGLGRALVTLRPHTVLEIASDGPAEASSRVDALRRRARRSLQLRTAAGVVFVSHELQRACLPHGARHLVLANGCPARPETPRTPPPRPTLGLICAAHQPWAGADRFVALARLLPELDFVLIGATPPGPDNLRCHPPVPEVEADRLLRGCSVGLGPLALHRKGMREASPLKTRHYLALGLPVVLPYEDTDIPRGHPAALHIPNTVDNVERAAGDIARFARAAHADTAAGDAALSLARGPLSVREKESQRLAFFEAVRGRR